MKNNIASDIDIAPRIRMNGECEKLSIKSPNPVKEGELIRFPFGYGIALTDCKEGERVEVVVSGVLTLPVDYSLVNRGLIKPGDIAVYGGVLCSTSAVNEGDIEIGYCINGGETEIHGRPGPQSTHYYIKVRMIFGFQHLHPPRYLPPMMRSL